MIELPKSLIYFIIWWAYEAPKKLFTVAKRLTLLVNQEFGFTLNLKLIFTPLYGDYSIIGRFIGFTLRIIFIVTGFIFVSFLSLITALLPLAWYILPFVGVYYLDFWFVPIAAGAYLYITFKKLNEPESKVENIKNDSRILKSFQPEVKRYYKSIKAGSIYKLKKFLKTPQINKILLRTEINETDFINKVSKKAKVIESEKIADIAFEYAKNHGARYVEIEHLFLAVIKLIPNTDTFLSTYGIDINTLEKGVKWIVERRDYYASVYFWQDDYEQPSMTGFGHGLTGRVTPDLDAVSRDFTKMAKKGRLKDVVGRDETIDEIARLLGGANKNVLLIGEPGCGKTTLIKGLAYRIMFGTEYKTLQNKRIVSLEMGNLIAGAGTSGQIAEKLKKALVDVEESKDIILFIDEIHSLAGSVNQDEGFSTVFSILEPHLTSDEIQFIGATSIENYRKFIEPVGSFSRIFEIVEMPEPSPEETLEILIDEAKEIENKHKVTITINALLESIKLSEKLVHDRVMPDKALDVIKRSASIIKNEQNLLTSKTVEEVVSEMTHIPVTELTQEESEKLKKVEEEMKKEVIGQDHALEKISAALKRARVGVRDENKPIAGFLFVGTTGVGKTKTAKTLSKVYFKSEDAMIRLDMSEYQTPDSIDKLIGTSDQESKGILTEAVRSKPFTLVLLDEIEKAHHNILTAFLQVLDDGRLTDSSGKTIDFTNTIIIATSNVGTKKIQKISEEGGSFEEIEKSALQSVREKFAPEFLNRFTAIVVYKTLSFENVKEIARLTLREVEKLAQEKDIKVTFEESLIEELAKRGYNPEWGARPLRRLVEDKIETYLADKIISGEIKQGDAITLGPETLN